MVLNDSRAPPSSHAPCVGALGDRLTALDHMRGFVIGLVVLHHVVLAYCTFGHIDRSNYALSSAPVVDAQRWVGFDGLVSLNDSFFMPLLFLLSGLFVRDWLVRKGARAFLRSRMLRLGLPFIIAEATVVPLAYYPSFLQAGGTASFAPFWVRTVTAGPWPSGPPWFIGVLLLFDVAVALAFVLVSHRRLGPYRVAWQRLHGSKPTGSLSKSCRSASAESEGARPAQRRAIRPISAFALLISSSCLFYVPLLLVVGPARWFAIGPLAIQASRIGLYASYFAAGVGLGLGGMQAVARFARAIAPRWAGWVLLAALLAATLTVVEAMSAREGLRLAGPRLALLGIAQAAFCAAAALALPALFLRFGGRGDPVWDSLAANSFAIYLLHYPVVTWVQYGLLTAQGNAVAKGTVAFAIALSASWAGAGCLRRLPIFERFL